MASGGASGTPAPSAPVCQINSVCFLNLGFCILEKRRR